MFLKYLCSRDAMNYKMLEDTVLEVLRPYVPERIPFGRNAIKQIKYEELRQVCEAIAHPRRISKTVPRPSHPRLGLQESADEYRSRMTTYLGSWGLRFSDRSYLTSGFLEGMANYLEDKTK